MSISEPFPSITAVSKVLNACDECRARKLKCSGESTGCTRCITDGVPCHYSPRKQMGRPRKRRREDGALSQDQDSRDLSYINGGGLNSQDPPPDYQYSMNETTYSTSNGDALMPVLDPHLPGLDMHHARLSDQGHRQNNQSANFNFDFSQELGTNPLIHFPELMPYNNLQPAVSNRSTTQLQAPAPPVDDYTATARGEAQPARCTCLPQLYIFLGSFQSAQNVWFPYSMGALKKAARFATEAVLCQNCSKEYTSALQNSMLLGTLMNLVINDYRRLLDHIDERSMNSEKMTLRMGEHSPGTEHLHTGNLDCPMGINVELNGDEWRMLARKTIRKEVFGPGDHNLTRILQEMKDRQQRWHSRYDGKLHQPRSIERLENTEEHGCVCIQGIFIDRLRQALDAFNL